MAGPVDRNAPSFAAPVDALGWPGGSPSGACAALRSRTTGSPSDATSSSLEEESLLRMPRFRSLALAM